MNPYLDSQDLDERRRKQQAKQLSVSANPYGQQGMQPLPTGVEAKRQPSPVQQPAPEPAPQTPQYESIPGVSPKGSPDANPYDAVPGYGGGVSTGGIPTAPPNPYGYGAEYATPDNGGNFRRGPSDFINLQRYLGVNQAQGQNMARALAANRQKQVAGAQQSLADTQQKFNGQLGSYLSSASDVPAGGGYSDATGAKYTGPSSLSDLNGGLEGQFKAAQGDVDALNTQKGMAGLLSKDIGGNYGGTMSGFDAFLAGNTDTGAMAALRNQFGGEKLGKQFTTADKFAQERAKAAPGQWIARANQAADAKAAELQKEQAAQEAVANQGRIDARAQARQATSYQDYIAQTNTGSTNEDSGVAGEKHGLFGLNDAATQARTINEKAYGSLTQDEWDQLMALTQAYVGEGEFGRLWGQVVGDPNDKALTAFVQEMNAKYG